MKNTKNKTQQNEGTLMMLLKVKAIVKKISLYVALVLVGIVVTAFYFRNDTTIPNIKIYKAGEVSVSLNERSELIFIERQNGKPLVVDSTLTEIVNNMLAAREYVRANTIR